ncbi:hypothetical protein [Actinophytocola sediminis]
MLPLAGASLAALALAGVAVYSVGQAGCANPGHYVEHDNGQVELVDSCLDPAHLPKPDKYQHEDTPPPAEPAVNELADRTVKAP